jgi:hypothetical protein
MSRAFSDYNSLSFQNMLAAISQALNKTISFQDNSAPVIANPVQLSPDFTIRRTNIKDWWNLDRSEAARRSYIDPFVYEAMDKSESESLIVTAEEYIASNSTQVGNGYLDYLVSAIDEHTTIPIYNPSIIIEAKVSIAGDPPNGQNQLLAEMVTLWQIKETQQGYTRGVLTDGRFWKFYEMHMSPGLILMSPVYDSEGDISQIIGVVSFLAKFFAMYDSGNSAFI